jgi:hypothetical protein
VLTTRMKGVRYPRTNITMQTRPGVSYSEVYDVFYGAEIVRWNREDNVVEPLYDLFALAKPSDAMFPMAWNTISGQCSGDVSLTGIECVSLSLARRALSPSRVRVSPRLASSRGPTR